MAYITPDIVDDEGAVAEGILTSVADKFDGWRPAEGHVVTGQAEAHAIATATALSELKRQLRDGYAGLGQEVLKLPRIAASNAEATSTWTLAVDTAFTIPAGTEVRGPNPAGQTQAFVVATDVAVTAGTESVSGVALVAVETGEDSNGVTGTVRFDGLLEIAGVVIDAPSSGGAPREEIDAYVSRLAERAKRMKFIPISVADYAAYALDVPGVARCLPLNRFNPATPSTDAPGHITLVCLDAFGVPSGSETLAAVVAYFALLETPLNVVVHAIGPAVLDVEIAGVLRPAANVDHDTLAAAAGALIRARLDPALWDFEKTAPGLWNLKPARKLSVYDVAHTFDDTPGLLQIVELTVNAGASVNLPAPITIPRIPSDGIALTVAT